MNNYKYSQTWFLGSEMWMEKGEMVFKLKMLWIHF